VTWGADSSRKPVYDRGFLLGEKRNEPLELWEVQQYGYDSFGDPDYVSIYGLKPADWYARGVRILGRTAVECTRDRLADLIGSDVAAIARTSASVSGAAVVDLFAGSGNTLYWLHQHIGVRCAIGFERDDVVVELARKSLSIVTRGVDLIHTSYDVGLKALDVAQEPLIVVFVAPPWGLAIHEASGLDLRFTTPPVSEVIDLTMAVLHQPKLLFATQVFEIINRDSLAEVTARFEWSTLKVYEIDAPGQNHGLLLGSRGWTPVAARGDGERSIDCR
jgi:predicted RNA methylase